EVDGGGGIEAGPEGRGRALDQAGLDGAAFGAPAGASALEDEDVAGPEGAEGPPDARGAEQAHFVIDDDLHVLRNAQGADGAGEIGGRGEHVGQVGIGVGNAVDIEEDRAGNMPIQIFGLGIAGGIGHVPAGIDHDEAGIVQMVSQPGRRDEGRGHLRLLLGRDLSWVAPGTACGQALLRKGPSSFTGQGEAGPELSRSTSSTGQSSCTSSAGLPARTWAINSAMRVPAWRIEERVVDMVGYMLSALR